MNYNELLNKMSDDITSATQAMEKKKAKASSTTSSGDDSIPILLNKIGLEVQRQGG